MNIEEENLKQKNIEWAADLIADTIFYHNNDCSQRERLKNALKIFANILMMNAQKANNQKDQKQ